MEKHTGKIDLESLCKLFKIPTLEDVIEENTDYVAECGASAVEEYRADAGEEATAEGEDEAREKWEQAASNEIFHNWHNAAMAAIEKVFADHGLTLEPVRVRRKIPDRPWDFRIRPVESWIDAADKIRDTVNGVGMFYAATLKVFLDSGPYTARQAVLSHLPWMQQRAEVYGDRSAARIYESAWR